MIIGIILNLIKMLCKIGCPKNQVDGEMMLSKLNKNGFQIVADIEDSDVMVINTCGSK